MVTNVRDGDVMPVLLVSVRITVPPVTIGFMRPSWISSDVAVSLML